MAPARAASRIASPRAAASCRAFATLSGGMLPPPAAIRLKARSVGQITVPCSRAWCACSGVIRVACSRLSTPASRALWMPGRVWAWAATRRPRACASSTVASISALVWLRHSALSPLDMTPPLVKILMPSAPMRA